MPYSRVERHVWKDEKFRRWPEPTRTSWLYILTGEHMNRVGMFVLDPLYIAADAQVTPAQAEAAIDTLEQAGRIAYDRDTRLMLVLRHLKHNAMENPNVVKAAAFTDLPTIPFVKPLWERLLEAVETFGPAETEKGAPFYSILADAIRKRLSDNTVNSSPNGSGNSSPNGMGNPDPDPEPDPEPHPVEVVSPAEPSHAREEQTTDDQPLTIESLAPMLHEQARAYAVAAFGEGSPLIAPFLVGAKRVTSGLDTECWKNGLGRSVPLEDRSRILALALLRWDEQGRVDALKSCVKYEALSQTDPHPSPVAKPHPDSQAARVSSEKPRESAPRGDRPAKLTVEDGGGRTVDDEFRIVAEWEKGATKAQVDVLRTQARREIAEDPKSADLRATMGEAAIRGHEEARYRKLVLEQIGDAAA